ncbi:MAG: hypothetical protein A2096_11515 [Spirochaetes bacterium GWF1_41_5]|nr:MAG: hypothetical protein A2096_11515 [Spirochaetes bacterium GWF1_41_5]HBE02049.1 hypothetical protein [Spirochaetia bacterium]
MKLLPFYDVRRLSGAVFAAPALNAKLLWWITTDVSYQFSESIYDTHNFHEIIYIKDGSGMIDINNNNYNAQKGKMYLICPGDKHKNYITNDNVMVIHYFAFQIENWKQILSHFSCPDKIQNDISDYADLLIPIYSKIQNEIISSDKISTGMIAHYIAILIFTLLRKTLNNTPGKEKLITTEKKHNFSSIVDFNSLDVKMSVEDMAKQSFLSRTYYTKLFKKETGLSPAKYVTIKKIQAAKKLLADNSILINEAARQVGFHDELYFSKVFKRIVGINPSQFRKLISF